MAPVLGMYNGWKALLCNTLYSKGYRLNYMNVAFDQFSINAIRVKSQMSSKRGAATPVYVVQDVLQQHKDSMGIWMHHAEDILYHSNMFCCCCCCCCFYVLYIKKMQQADRGTTDKVTKNAWQKKCVKRLGYTIDCPWNLKSPVLYNEVWSDARVCPVFYYYYFFLCPQLKIHSSYWLTSYNWA